MNIKMFKIFLVIVFAGFSSHSYSMEFSDDMIDEEDSPFDSNIYTAVKTFNISDIRLGMKTKDVIKKMKKKKYRQIDTVYKTPEYFRYNYDKECRERNILQYDSLKLCISSFARRDKVEFVEKMIYENPETKEKIDIYFTSNFTDNVVYKIHYQNDLNKILGEGKHFKYQREEGRRAFWYNVIKKYGEPNLDDTTWRHDTEEEDSVTLKASFEGLILQASGMYKQDLAESIQKARETFKAQDFTF